jgi:hypothetical protein
MEHAKPTIPGTSCILGLTAIWMNDVKSADDLDDWDRFSKDLPYAQHLADMNLLTYLIDHRDGRDGNFLESTDPSDPRIFAVDNGIAFEGFPWNFFVHNWNSIRVPWLRADPIARLRALPPDEPDRLGTLFDMDADAQGVLRVAQPTTPLDPTKGVRIAPDKVQLGLTAKEIARFKERIRDLLADVDAGKVKVQ